MQIGIYRNSKLEVYNEDMSVLLVKLTDEEKEMISNISEENILLTSDPKLNISEKEMNNIINNFNKIKHLE